MSSLPAQVFTISLAIGAVMWKQSAINCLLQNKRITIVLTGSHAAAVGNALKVQLPGIKVEAVELSFGSAMLIGVLGMVLVQPLLDVLNVAFSRNYQVKVRWKARGPGVMDDECIFEMVP